MDSHLKRVLRPFVAPFGPTFESIRSGHLRSALLARSVDRHGRELPWYSAPAIDALDAMDFAGKSVLEFGGGNSTLWWASRGASVTTVETQGPWIAEIDAKLKARGQHVTFIEVTAPPVGRFDGRERSFDIAVIDDTSGLEPNGRYLNFELALPLVKEDGIIIVDNSDMEHVCEILKHDAANENLRIDFWGLCPGSVRRSCTSVIFLGRKPV